MAEELTEDQKAGVSVGDYVHVLDAQEHGYSGRLPHTEDPEAHTVAAVTGGTANVEDEPTSAAGRGSAKRTASRPAAKTAD